MMLQHRVVLMSLLALTLSVRPGAAAAGGAELQRSPQASPAAISGKADASGSIDDPKEVKGAGLWPSQKLLGLMLSRWGDEAAARYELDDRQKQHVQEELVERWSEFLEEQRPVLQPLANEFLEMRMGMEPPPSDQVKEWSARALPALQKVREELRETQAEFREVLTPSQRARFEIDALKTGAGLQLAESKLRRWSEGEVEPEDMWEPTPAVRRERRKARDAAKERQEDADDKDSEVDDSVVSSDGGHAAPAEGQTQERRGKPVDQIALELSAWEKFVADFIARHDLNEGQRTAALSCLKELSERAAAHRDRHRVEIEALEMQIESPEPAAEKLEEIRTKLHELYGPVDAMFAELKSRLEAIPTAEQRSRAAEAGQK